MPAFCPLDRNPISESGKSQHTSPDILQELCCNCLLACCVQAQRRAQWSHVPACCPLDRDSVSESRKAKVPHLTSCRSFAASACWCAVCRQSTERGGRTCLPSAPWNASLFHSLKKPTSMTKRCQGRMWTSWWAALPVSINSTPLRLWLAANMCFCRAAKTAPLVLVGLPVGVPCHAAQGAPLGLVGRPDSMPLPCCREKTLCAYGWASKYALKGCTDTTWWRNQQGCSSTSFDACRSAWMAAHQRCSSRLACRSGTM